MTINQLISEMQAAGFGASTINDYCEVVERGEASAEDALQMALDSISADEFFVEARKELRREVSIYEDEECPW